MLTNNLYIPFVKFWAIRQLGNLGKFIILMFVGNIQKQRHFHL